MEIVNWRPLDNAQRQLRKQHDCWHELRFCRGNRGNEVLLQSEDGTALQWVRPDQVEGGHLSGSL